MGNANEVVSVVAFVCRCILTTFPIAGVVLWGRLDQGLSGWLGNGEEEGTTPFRIFLRRMWNDKGSNGRWWHFVFIFIFGQKLKNQLSFWSTSLQDTETVQPHLVFLKKWSPVDRLASKERYGFQWCTKAHWENAPSHLGRVAGLQ